MVTRFPAGDVMKQGYFPGHMAAGGRTIAAMVRAADVLLHVLDARAPKSTAGKLPGDRRRRPLVLVVLNKSDLADPSVTDRWVRYFKEQGEWAIAVDSHACSGIGPMVRHLFGAGGRSVAVSVAVVGMPNVGKSSLINCLAGRARAPRGDRPGITKTPQWIGTERGLRLLDTPGVTHPGTLDEQTAWTLACLGVVPENAVDPVVSASWLLDRLPDVASAVAGRHDAGGRTLPPKELLAAVAAYRGLLGSGGVPLLEQAAIVVLREFRQGKLGRFTLETPDG